jgi:serine/threonine protein kinase
VTIPDYQSLMAPVLGALADGQEQPVSRLRETLVGQLKLAGEDLTAALPSGGSLFGSRVQRAVTYLYHAGLLSRPRRGVVQITPRGREILAKHPDRIDVSVLRQFEEFVEFRSRSRRGGRGMVGDLGGEAGGSLAGLGSGSRVAGYRLERQVGAGGMAVVFQAHDERLNRQVALKILAPALAADEEFRQRFLHESQAAAAVDDPHIIPVYEAGEAGGMLFLAMRYVPGGDVRSLIHRAGPLPAARVEAIVSPVASALDAAHAAGLVHRDVKPGNMLLDTRPGRADHVYLSDFGLSKVALSPADLTGSGRFMGTADYIAPEQIKGEPVDGRADQYALACSAFELLTGAPPFRLDDVLAVIYAQTSEPPPLLTSRRPDLPPEADQVLATALAKKPEDRYQSCQDFADALAAALGLAPRDSGLLGTAEPPGPGPDGASAPAHPPTRFAWSPVSRAADRPLWAADAASPAAAGDTDPAAGDAYLQSALTTSGPLATPGPGPPGAGYADRRVRHRPSRTLLIALVAITVVVTGAVTAGLRLVASRGSPARGVQIGARSGLPPADGEVYVRYRDGANATARIYGQISDAAPGEIARLYAQPFPYRHTPAPAGSLSLHPAGATAGYKFAVTPAIATRYRVELFKNATAARPLATSATATVYVTLTGITGHAHRCHRPVCRERFHVRVLAPAPALTTEMAKQWHPYFGLRLAARQQPATPQVLLLGAGTPRISKPRRISGDEFGFRITFSFGIGKHAYSWNWTACTRPTEAIDGIGLPRSGDCGSKRIRAFPAATLTSSCTRQQPCGASAPGFKPAPQPNPAPAPAPPPGPASTQPQRPPTSPTSVSVSAAASSEIIGNLEQYIGLAAGCILLTVLWMAGDGLRWLLRRRTPAAKATVKALQPDSRSCSGQGPGARPLSSGTSSRPCPARAAAGTRPTGSPAPGSAR